MIELFLTMVAVFVFGLSMAKLVMLADDWLEARKRR